MSSDTSSYNNGPRDLSTADSSSNLEELTYTMWPNNPYRLVPSTDPILRTVCAPVENFDYGELRDIVSHMQNVMQSSCGIGLAAPQVGLNKRIILAGTSIHVPVVMINPVIIEANGSQMLREGCLSFPGLFMNVERSARIVVEFYDCTGNKHQCPAGRVFATCVQHEIDHLDGKLFTDRVSPLKLNLAMKKREKARRHR